MRFQELMERLNDEQRYAVTHDSDVVVLAGPGSGKTDTITAKAARLLLEVIPAPQGVACLTYSNDAAAEFAARLRAMGFRRGQRLFVGTVHSFCRNLVLRPFADLVGEPHLARPKVITDAARIRLLKDSLDAVGVWTTPKKISPRIKEIREALVSGRSLDAFGQRDIRLAQHYEGRLSAEGFIDFDGMTLAALRIIRTSATVRDLLISRFPWLAIDEYQDLGGTLHQIVLALRESGSHVFAVGDADQCIFGFTGADPAHLQELADLPDIEMVPLVFNYRSGDRLIAAAHAGLGEHRDYRAAPGRTDAGQIYLDEKGGGLDGQATFVVDELIPELLAQGTEPHEIAVLYKQRGPVLDALNNRMAASTVPFAHERDIRFPTSPIIMWLKRCATKAAGSPEALPLADLELAYRDLLPPATSAADWLDARVRLYEALATVNVDEPLQDWLAEFNRVTGLRQLLVADGTRPDEIADLDKLNAAHLADATVSDFGDGMQERGRVVVTTCHGSKGRQFDAVIIPGLQPTLFPFAAHWEGFRILPDELVKERRLFYVALTRARYVVHLVYSPMFRHPDTGQTVRGRSQFVDEIAARLSTMQTPPAAS